MPKMKLDQKQPAKANPKLIAQRKKAKMLKEQAKFEELQKQFPKLFSPQKMKNIEERQKQLVQSSLKKEVGFEDSFTPTVSHKHKESEDQENMPENTTNKQPFASPPLTESPQKKAKGLQRENRTPLTANHSNSKRVLQVLTSPSPASSHTTTIHNSSRVSFLPGCSCAMPVTGTGTGTGTGTEGMMDDVENQQCDICAQIAPLANTRKDVVHALRNFLNKPPTEVVMPVEKEEEKREEKKDDHDLVEEEKNFKEVEVVEEVVDVISEKSPKEENQAGQQEDTLSGNNLFEDLNMEMPPSMASEEDSQVFDEEIIDDKSERDVTAETATATTAHDCFNDTLVSSLADGRVRGRIVGRKVLTDHVEFIFKIQVLKEGYNFQELNDKEYLADCMSPSSHVTRAHSTEVESPYVIQMCILRRYSDFEKLQENLIMESKKGNVQTGFLQTTFPAKQFFPSFGKRWADPSFLQSRELGLTQWMNEAVLPALSALKKKSNIKRSNTLRGSFVKAIHNFMSM